MIAREIKREPKNERGGGGGKGRKRQRPFPALLLAPFFAPSLTLVSRSLLLNRTETLATQAIPSIKLLTEFTAIARISR